MTAATTETTELVGGPRDGDTEPYTRPAGTDMPQIHPAVARYELAAVETRAEPVRWRYRWIPERPARAHACSKHDPPRPGCPGYRTAGAS